MEKKGTKRDVVLMNSAAALVVAGKAKDFRGGAAIAAEAIDSGAAIKKLEEIKRYRTRLLKVRASLYRLRVFSGHHHDARYA